MNGPDTIKTLPRFEEAAIPDEKFTHYSLNPERDKDKATAFVKALGYDLSNWQGLRDDIK
jgi:hypothetical protein